MPFHDILRVSKLEVWQNGAFTEVYLEALGRGADSDRNGVISMTELTRHMTTGVPRLVHQVRPEWNQTLGVKHGGAQSHDCGHRRLKPDDLYTIEQLCTMRDG